MMTLASGGAVDYRRPQSANSRLRRTHPREETTTTSNNPYKDQEIFGQHILKSRRGDGDIQESACNEAINEVNSTSSHSNVNEEVDDCDNDEFDENSSEAEQIPVVSAQEYAAKIIKLQQACLIPLKEDLADWLNKILKTSQITTGNFMDKLDNGVILCRLAEIISSWCKQLLESQDNNTFYDGSDRVSNLESAHEFEPPSPRPRLQNNNQAPSATIHFNGPLKASTTSQSTNCLIKTSASSSSLNNGSNLSYHSNQFLNNLIRMHHTKIWEDAKCRTFYARDNVCNFIKWSRNFGVNRSVLFESDDLVLHANPRQVVLCLLDVARIAYVKYGFTEAPGLVKFEQEIDKEIASERESISRKSDGFNSAMKQYPNLERDSLFDVSSSVAQIAATRKVSLESSRTRASIADATDELVMRYCRHKEKEAARKRREEEENDAAERVAAQREESLKLLTESNDSSPIHAVDLVTSQHIDQADRRIIQPDSLMTDCIIENQIESDDIKVTSTSDPILTNGKNFIADHGRVDSLDSGEGPTESASTAHSSRLHEGSHIIFNCDDTNGSPTNVQLSIETKHPSDHSLIPANLPTTSSSATENSEISSSRSSLLSNQDCNNSSSNYGRQITSDLDGKVMRIAKSYYGKKATKDVTRLSEGKYKIADRIVFVRLLKGHRVMVRIGGGWDTLENFLFRHKSDPTQIIDPDNLLPLETKMSLEKSTQVTPKATPSRSPASVSKLPNYRRSNSASSTNLSLSNLSFSNMSLASSNNLTPLKQVATPRLNNTMIGSSYSSSPSVDQTPKRQIPRLFIHKGQPVNRDMRHMLSANTSAFRTKSNANNHPQQSTPQLSSAQATTTTPNKFVLKKPQSYHNNRMQYPQQRTAITPNPVVTRSIHLQRPLASSRASTFSVSNLYPATLTTNSKRSRS